MAALYAKDKLNQPDEAEPVVKQLIAMEPNDTGSYFALVQDLRGRRQGRRTPRRS